MSVNLALRLNGSTLELFNSDTGQLAATLQADISHSWATTQIGTLSGASEESGSSASLIHQASVTLDNAQVIALPTAVNNATQMVPAVAGQVPLFVGGLLVTDTRQGVYTNVSASVDIFFSYAAATIGDSASLVVVKTLASQLLSNAARSLTQFIPNTYVISADDQLYAFPSSDDWIDGDLSFQLYNAAGNFAGGHANNTFVITAEFRVWDVALRKYLTTDESGWVETTRTFA